MSNEKFKVKFGLAVGDTKATVDGTTGDINTDGSITALQNLDIRGATTLGNAPADTVTVNGDTLIQNALTIGSSSGDTVTVNSQVTGNVTFSDNSTTTSRGVTGTVGTNDYWKYGGGATGSNSGYAEIATGDDGTEPIYARQYTAGSPRTLTLMDASGNTGLAGDLTVGGTGYIYSTTGLALQLTGANVRTPGDLQIDGGDLVMSSATANIANTTATTLNIGGAATTVSIGANTGTTTINNSLVADDISIATVDTTNLEVTNIKAKDGTAAATIADSTGIITVSSQLNVDNLNFNGNSIISTDTNGNITLAPNGTGDVLTNFSNGGNIYNNRNYVMGVIRNSTTDSIGDIWALNSTGPVTPFRGVSLDNSADTTRGPGTVLRSFSGGAVSGSATRGRVIFEKARGTSASPTAVQSGDILGSIDATGYTSTGWINDNVTAVVPAFFGFTASENWVSNTNLGTSFSLSMAPTATTVTSTANLIQTLTVQPENTNIRGDRMSLSQGKTAQFTATGCSTSGTTLTIGTLASGTIGIGQVIQAAGPLNGIYIVANISGSGSGSTWQMSSNPGTLSAQSIVGANGMIGMSPVGTSTDILSNLKLIKNNILSSDGTAQITTSAAGSTLTLKGDTLTLQTAASASLVGNKISYNRVFGQWQYNTTITPAAANTAYVFPGGTADFNNIATVANTSQLIPGASGYYNYQFSVQCNNTSNTAYDVYIWSRKNGVDVPGSMGRVSVPAQHAGQDGKIIAGWNYLVDPSNATDYFELAYAVENTAVSFTAFAANSAGFTSPGTATLVTTLTPVGA